MTPRRNLFSTLALLLSTLLCLPSLAQNAPPSWRLAGNLSEACTCSVPCACNFGANPSPHSFCWALFSLDIQKGNYGSVALDGLRMAGAQGGKGFVIYIDERANKEQAAALKHIAEAIGAKFYKIAGLDPTKQAPEEFRFRGFKTAKIEQVVGDKNNRLQIGDAGGFESDYILGIDGKTPVVVENNWSWNIQHGIKGKTKRLHYKDSFGNAFDFKDTNANQGKFDWSDTTPIYFR